MSETNIQPLQSSPIPEQVFTPSEIIGIFNETLARQSTSAKIVYMRGVYLPNARCDTRWAYAFDALRDENTQDEITLRISWKQREELKSGNIVSVGGLLGRQINNKGFIQLVLNVSRIEIVKEQFLDENEVKRIEIRQQKVKNGFKGVDAIIEQKLFVGERPRIALVYATTSITDKDFEAGIKAARAAIDFVDSKVNFASPNEFCAHLQDIDQKGYTAIALVRGGGGGLDHLEDLKILATVANLKTPVISAVGHVAEKIFFKQIVDKETPTPNGLGAYFADIVESVSQKKNKSVAVITEQIRKQFQEQIETSKKQNKELQDKLGQLTKASEESQKQHKAQIEEANKLNKGLQERMEALNKNMETAQKNHNQQMTVLQHQLKIQLDEAEKARKEQQEADERKTRQFNESLAKMQESNTSLQKSLSEATAQGTEAIKHAKELELQLAELKSGKSNIPAWVWIVFVLCAIIIAVLLFR